MKILRSVLILVLVAGLMLASVGSVLAQHSTDTVPSSHPNLVVRAQWRAFFGNVTEVNGNNITIATKHSGDVVVTLKEMTRFKILGYTGWIKLDEFKERLQELLGVDLSALQGKRVAVLAINVGGASGELTGDALLFAIIPPPELLVHHHTNGVVIEYTPGAGGDVTIKDILGRPHQFTIGNDTSYLPAGTEPSNIAVNSFVTVVSEARLNAQPVAKVIILYKQIPEGWPTP